VVCLGAFAWDAALRIFRFSPKPKFFHGAEVAAGAVTLLGCYHPSQQNTFTRILTPEMLDVVLLRARTLVAQR
jgi:uracil-DNA glycosylase